MKTIAIAAVLLALTGCSSIKEILIDKPIIVERPKIELPTIEPSLQKPFAWVIITKDNFEEKMKELEKNGGELVFFALTSKGYENLSLNTADLRRYILQQQAIIAAYKQYYESSQTPAEPKK